MPRSVRAYPAGEPGPAARRQRSSLASCQTGAMLVLACAASAAATAAPGGESAASAGGRTRLAIAVDGKQLLIHLTSPVDPLSAARAADEKQPVDSMMTRLQRTDSLFIPTAAANCLPSPVEVNSPPAGKAAGRGSEHGVDMIYHFSCAAPGALKDLEVKLFSIFPRLQRIDVQLTAPTGQKSGQLSARQPVFTW